MKSGEGEKRTLALFTLISSLCLVLCVHEFVPLLRVLFTPLTPHPQSSFHSSLSFY